MVIVQRRIVRLLSTKKTVEGAFTQRLKELEEQYPKPNDPLLGTSSSIINDDPNLVKLEKDLYQRKFEYENQVSIQATKIPSYADRSTRETAHTQPWTGKETTVAANLRMLNDSHRPSKSMREAMKLGKARDKVLDLKLNKLGQSNDEDSQFREIYTEKFTPIGSFDKIKTLADVRIDEAMRRGEFKNIPRGSKLDVSVGAYVDRTEHHLNNILVKQNLAPPWIEKQGGVNVEIESFKNELREKWISHVDLFYHRDHDQMKREFEQKWSSFIDTRITLVNNSIRTYNLQAPLSTQKFYLQRPKEISRCYQDNDVDKVREYIKRENERRAKEAEQKKQENKSSFWNWW